MNVNEPSLNTLNMIQSPKGCLTPLRDCDNLPCLHYVDSYSYIIQFSWRHRGEFIKAYIIYTCLVEGTLIFVRVGGMAQEMGFDTKHHILSEI